jgi:hypothetical protein
MTLDPASPTPKHLNLHLGPLNGSSDEDDPTAAAAAIATSDAALFSGANAVTYLTPEGLMAYCQSRLDSINGQAQGIFSQQQLRNGEISAINNVAQEFQRFTAGVDHDQKSCALLESSLHDLIGQLSHADPGCPEIPKLKQLYNDLVYSGTGPAKDPTQQPQYFDVSTFPPVHTGPQGDNTLDNTEMQTFITKLQGCASDLNSSSELQMIQLQSLMSERQTAIQLTTNLVQSLGDQYKKIVENVGH